MQSNNSYYITVYKCINTYTLNLHSIIYQIDFNFKKPQQLTRKEI